MAVRSIIHLSDIHIGRGKKESRRATAIFRGIAQSFPNLPVVITGDLADSATERQVRSMRARLNVLARTNPILVVPGNHDYAWKGVIMRPGSWERWTKYLGTPLGWGKPPTPWMGPSEEPVGVDGLGVWKHGPLVFFGVDSGDPDDKVHTSRGWVSSGLANALEESLKQYAGKTRIVFLHHHPFYRGFFMKLKGADRFMRALKDSCELLLFGHKHKHGVWWHHKAIPLTVASHKTTNLFSENRSAITVIDIVNPGTPELYFNHRLELVG